MGRSGACSLTQLHLVRAEVRNVRWKAGEIDKAVAPEVKEFSRAPGILGPGARRTQTWHSTPFSRASEPPGPDVKPSHASQLLVFLLKDTVHSTCRPDHVFLTITVASSWGTFLHPASFLPHAGGHWGHCRQSQSLCQFAVLSAAWWGMQPTYYLESVSNLLSDIVVS